MSTNWTEESFTVETSDQVMLQTTIFNPEQGGIRDNLVIVLVHPYSVLGGSQALLNGFARGFASEGYKALTFNMRGVGKSTGRASLTGSHEIKDVVAVCKWTHANLSADRILLVGSSAGAPIAGSAVDKVEQVIGYVSLGYPFGLMSSILFGRHYKAILKSPKPKLFVMGTRDGFTSVKQLNHKLKSAEGRVESHLMEGVSHFQMEGPYYEAHMVIGYVSLGYPFGLMSSILFGRHYKAILKSPKPKLFVMGTRDGFTSVKQLNHKLKSAEGRVESHLMEGVCHFQMEGPYYEAHMVDLILEFIESL